jgi:hypothetical protein
VAEADSSVHGIRIADLITQRTFAVVPKCADGRALIGAGEISAFSVILSKLMLDKSIIKSELPARHSLAQTAPRRCANSFTPAVAESPKILQIPVEIARS